VQEPEGTASWANDDAFVTAHVSGDDLQHRRFACAVTAHQADLVAGHNYEGGLVEQNTVSVLLVNTGCA